MRTQDFAKLVPSEKTPRRSLAEETEGLRTMLQVAREMAEAKTDKPKPAEVARWQPALATLERIERDGLLEAFALLERADQDLARDYPAYRKAHREQLARFIRVYWCGLD